MEILATLTDGTNKEFDLWQSVWQHIQAFHPEIDSIDLVKKILRKPDYIIRSKWEISTHLYYKKRGKYYKVIVVDIINRRIKTAYTTDKLKPGEVVWKRGQ